MPRRIDIKKKMIDKKGRDLKGLQIGEEKKMIIIQEEVSLDRITESTQVREEIDEEKMRELVESVKQHGVLQPVLLEKLPGEKFRVVAGHRRVEAARRAGLKLIPAVIINQPLGQGDSLVLQLAENLIREDLNPFEVAGALQQILEASSITLTQLAEKLGFSKAYVSNILSINKLRPLLVKYPFLKNFPRRELVELSRKDPKELEETLKKLKKIYEEEGEEGIRKALQQLKERKKKTRAGRPAGKRYKLSSEGLSFSIHIRKDSKIEKKEEELKELAEKVGEILRQFFGERLKFKVKIEI